MPEENVVTPPAALRVPGHDPQPARVVLLRRPRAARLTRAALALLVCWGAIPVVFFIPPHIPWVLLAFVLGCFFAWSNLRGTFVVREFEGACPRCGTPLALKPGTRIRPPHRLVCYHCHHEPRLFVAA